MGPIVVRCPVTGAEFEVGIETDRDTFDTLPDVTSTAKCPHCGDTHEWSPIRARLRLLGRGETVGRRQRLRPAPVLTALAHEHA